MTTNPRPWRAAAATGIGSMPGTSATEAARIVVGELPDFVHVPELPARGPGSDIIGRTGGLLAAVSSGLGLETTPDGWRISRTVGRQMRLAQSRLAEDLDAIQEQADGFTGPVKSQLAGPWTLCAAIELPTGERVLRDEGACWDLAQALAEAARSHLVDLRRRFPRAASIVLQFDEPGLPAVLAGRIGTASGLSSYRAVDAQVAQRALELLTTTGDVDEAVVGFHCCADEAPLDLFRASGAGFVSIDATRMQVDQSLDEPVGRAFDAGLGLFLGSVPSTGSGRLTDARASAPIRALLHRLGLEDRRWIDQIVVTPSCGLAAADPTWVRTALAACREVGRGLRDDESEAESSA